MSQQSTITNLYTWGLDLSGSLEGAGGIGGLLASSRGTGSAESRVAASSDDAEEACTGLAYVDSSDLGMVNDEGATETNQTVGMRFLNMRIPPGATITNAYVQFKVDAADSAAATLVIRAQAADNAGTFSTNNNDVTDRSLTSASVTWNVPAWGTVGEAGASQKTPDLSAVIQEVVSRSGWQGGNAIVLVVTGSGKRVAEAYDGDSAGAPLLHVDYDPHAFYLFDGNGNVTHLIDSTGTNVVAQYDYDPVGAITKSSGTMASANTFRFSTKPFEPDVGIGYWGYRWYAPNQNRWLSRDPIGEDGGVNQFSFVRNDPHASFDSVGLMDQAFTAEDGSEWRCRCEDCLNKTVRLGVMTTGEGKAEWPWGGVAYEGDAPYARCIYVDDNIVYNACTCKDEKSDRDAQKKCVGKARVLAMGRPENIGKTGGWGIPVAAGSAAVAPEQWGGKGYLRPYIARVRGRTGGGQSFVGITEVIGGGAERKKLIADNPGHLIIELTTGQDEGRTTIELKIPRDLRCPDGTSEVP